ncbi:recombinase family protein [Deinococcus yunweiensis]|uniref:recombinase family protein n=1 Tax=Deinococcus yunweiensis TaxID=367282 RepID=UPI00398EAF5F
MRAIAYYRVSRQKQAVSGLGLEAQQANVAAFARVRGYEVIAAYTEVETGTNKRRRPELAAALEDARRQGAELLIAKLDRLARNVHFVSGLMESRVRFTAVDMPEVDTLTVHILAAVAEKEAKMISTRTKDALTAAKARGVTLGTPANLTHAAQLQGARRRPEHAVTVYQLVSGYIHVLRAQGQSYRMIAARLNQEGHRTVTGKRWGAVQVRNVVLRGAQTSPGPVGELPTGTSLN